MSRESKAAAGALKERDADKRRLVKRLGRKAIHEAVTRLCRNCTEPCKGSLYPLTMTGKDCPYFTEKREEGKQ